MKEEITLQKFYEAFVVFAKVTSDRLDTIDMRLDRLEHRSEIHEARLNALTAVVVELKETVIKIDKRLISIEQRMGMVEGRLGAVEATLLTKDHFKNELKAFEERIVEKIEEEIQGLAQTTYKSILHDRPMAIASQLD